MENILVLAYLAGFLVFIPLIADAILDTGASELWVFPFVIVWPLVMSIWILIYIWQAVVTLITRSK